MNTQQVQTCWEAPPAEAVPCQIEVAIYSDSERLMKAVKFGAVLGIAGIATIFIPIVHFFAPPILLTLAVVMVNRNLKLKEAAVAVSGNCTSCNKDVRAELGTVTLDYPLWTSCPNCRERFRVLPPAATSQKA